MLIRRYPLLTRSGESYSMNSEAGVGFGIPLWGLGLLNSHATPLLSVLNIAEHLWLVRGLE